MADEHTARRVFFLLPVVDEAAPQLGLLERLEALTEARGCNYQIIAVNDRGEDEGGAALTAAAERISIQVTRHRFPDDFPDVPVNSVVAHPSVPNVVYAGTDLGVFQGTYTGTRWSWGTLGNGFPQAAQVYTLAADPDSGLQRAWTFGRSAFEAQVFPTPNPDLRANTVDPSTGVLDRSVRIATGNSGQSYGVVWEDDRDGANNWHLYYRGYTYDSIGRPVPLGDDVRIDDTIAHVAQAPSLGGFPSDTSSPYCSRVAWHDDRLAPGTYQHVFWQSICSDGQKTGIQDTRVEQHATDINATNASVASQPDFDFAIAWHAERTPGSALHDVYARFYATAGCPKGTCSR